MTILSIQNYIILFLVVIVVQGSNLKVGEFEGPRVFDISKAFELDMFMQCLG